MDLTEILLDLGIKPKLAKYFAENYGWPQLDHADEKTRAQTIYDIVEMLRPLNSSFSSDYPELYYKPGANISFNPELLQKGSGGSTEFEMGLTGKPTIPTGTVELVPQRALPNSPEWRTAQSLGHELLGHYSREEPMSAPELNYQAAGAGMVDGRYRGDIEGLADLAGMHTRLPPGISTPWEERDLQKAFPDEESKAEYMRALFMQLPHMRSASWWEMTKAGLLD